MIAETSSNDNGAAVREPLDKTHPQSLQCANSVGALAVSRIKVIRTPTATGGYIVLCASVPPTFRYGILLYFQIMPTHRANSKARAVFRQESEKAEASTPFRRTPALHATPLQAMLRQESVTLSRVTPFHSATLHYIHSISSTLQHRHNSARLPLCFCASQPPPRFPARFSIRLAPCTFQIISTKSLFLSHLNLYTDGITHPQSPRCMETLFRCGSP